MHWTNPGDLGRRRCTRADVVDSTNIAAIEANTRALTEHDGVGRIGGGEREKRRYRNGIVFGFKREGVKGKLV